MIPEYFTNNIIFLTSVDVLGRTIIHNTLDVYRTLMVGESSADASTLYVSEKVGILTETPNVELTVNGKISSNSIIYDEIGNSTQWNSVYTSVLETSANWDSTYNTLYNLSASLEESDEILVTVKEYLSTNNILICSLDVFSNVNIETYLDVGETLYVGDQTTLIPTLYVNDSEKVGILTETPNVELTVNGKISSNSIIYDEIGNSTQWNSVYTNINQNSATYATIEFSNNKFLPLSGGIVTGDLIVDNTLQVGDGNPNFDFIITEDGNVGINTETPNEKLTVVGNISCTGLLYGDGSNLTGIVAGDTVATTLVRTNSANWDSIYTSVTETSANWDSVYTSVIKTSSNWDSVYTNVLTNSSTYVKTIDTNTVGVSAVKNILVVSSLPLIQEPNTLYILV
jgi:nitroimidazol reductase NimA-like FMN-containing flavoprotein (pyridoxamine 5'-phosphate oxidase superfamily)